MFETVEVGKKLDKKTYKEKLPCLREALLDAQSRLREANFSVVIVVAGAEGAGKGALVNGLVEWLDAREIETHAISGLDEEDANLPPFYRFWRRLPGLGKISIFFGSWYTAPIVSRIEGSIDTNQFEREMQRIVEFERMLTNERTLVIKVWLHITKDQQKKTFKTLEKNPETAWRVKRRDWDLHKTYNKFIKVAESAIRQTSTGHAPWHVVEASDKRYRDIDVAEHLLGCLVRRLDEPDLPKPTAEPLPVPDAMNVLSTLKVHPPLKRDEYERELMKWQSRLNLAARRMTANDLAAAIVFEGSDGAGKGGCIRRAKQALDARFYQIIPIAAPTDEERARPYLWRFWRRLPRKGHIHFYDRSWYGRVLVERIESLCDRSDWQRAYSEINAFEQELTENRILVLKFWLAIGAEEQLNRFKKREQIGYKRYKLTSEDWRNREKAPAYEKAACDMIGKTSTSYAPWTLVEADDKYFARIEVLRTICRRLEQELSASKPKRHQL